MSISITRGEKTLYQALSSNSKVTSTVGTKIKRNSAKGAAPPYVIWQFQGGRGLKIVGGIRLWDDLDFIVKAVCEGESLAPIETTAEGIQEALEDKQFTIDGRLVSTFVSDPITYEETDPDNPKAKYQHLGWRVLIRA